MRRCGGRMRRIIFVPARSPPLRAFHPLHPSPSLPPPPPPRAMAAQCRAGAYRAPSLHTCIRRWPRRGRQDEMCMLYPAEGPALCLSSKSSDLARSGLSPLPARWPKHVDGKRNGRGAAGASSGKRRPPRRHFVPGRKGVRREEGRGSRALFLRSFLTRAPHRRFAPSHAEQMPERLATSGRAPAGHQRTSTRPHRPDAS